MQVFQPAANIGGEYLKSRIVPKSNQWRAEGVERSDVTGSGLRQRFFPAGTETDTASPYFLGLSSKLV